jgi:hypothetical protein
VEIGCSLCCIFGVCSPAQTLIINLSRGHSSSLAQTKDLFVEHTSTLRSVRGPLWFNSLLWVFDSVHVLFRTQFQRLKVSMSFEQVMTLGILVNFLIRIPFPLGRDHTPLNLELGYLSQYIASYILGTRSTSTSNHRPTNLSEMGYWLLQSLPVSL